ncbi:hypothetical protein, partial [Mycoplasmopsis bovis]|uniref:hypothetical protein n=1 Tax=Mycoplasmopsis bovis TaxID=28903 RepID=UPI003D269E86
SSKKSFCWDYEKGSIEGDIKPYQDKDRYTYPTIDISGIKEKINDKVNPPEEWVDDRDPWQGEIVHYYPNPNAFKNAELVLFIELALIKAKGSKLPNAGTKIYLYFLPF